MKKFVSLTLLASLLIPFSLSAQTKLEENLKAVMLLFDKNRKEAEDEIDSLTIINNQLSDRNSTLNKELEDSWNKIQALETENLVLRSKISEGAVLEIETAALVTPQTIDAPSQLDTPKQLDTPRKRPAAEAPIPDFTPDSYKELSPPSNGAEHLSEGTLLLVNLNTATERELKMIPGIGPAMAKRLIDARPFASVWDLMKLQGMGRKRIESISPYITLE